MNNQPANCCMCRHGSPKHIKERQTGHLVGYCDSCWCAYGDDGLTSFDMDDPQGETLALCEARVARLAAEIKANRPIAGQTPETAQKAPMLSGKRHNGLWMP